MTNPRVEGMKQSPEGTFDCIVVGGCADGVLLNSIRMDAQKIELARPDYIKPLSSPNQDSPEVIKESDFYYVHPLGLKNDGEKDGHLFGIAVVVGQSLTWAFSQLVIGYVENVTARLVKSGAIETN